ncbi:hypothetical protein AYO44_07920 [Planctomycetaceae bacterium SCGC AG-212-F19]|nr:hypothetical protein AYO44_07920 [Planctomycetaceae bacterium SCGC AG-212-F19]
MSIGFPCRNPGCAHIFPPAALAGARALNCPRCGAVFDFGTGTVTAPAAPARPEGPGRGGALPPPVILPGSAPTPLPAATPAAPLAGASLPTAIPIPMATEDPLPEPAESPPGRRRQRAASGWVFMATALILGAGILGIICFVYIKLGLGDPVAVQPTQTHPILSRHVSSKFLYSYDFPAAPWTMDNSTKTVVGSNLFAISRSNPDAWMTLMAREYPTTPRDGQLFDEFYRRMEPYFTDLRYEHYPDGLLAGQRALRFVFHGKAGGVSPVVGEAHLMTHQGIGYALFTWSAAESVAEAAREYEELRGKFALVGERPNWADNRQPAAFEGMKVAYTLRDEQGIWKKNADYMQVFKADLALEALDPLIPDPRGNTGLILLTVRPKQANLAAAAALARAELEKEHRKDYPETKMEPVAGLAGPLDRDGPVGEQPGHVAKLHVTNSPIRQRFVVLATAPMAQRTVVIMCECPWARRTLWERDFDQLIGTLRLNP